MEKFFPEGILLDDEKNQSYLSSLDGLKIALKQGITLEAIVKYCDAEHNLIIDIDGVFAKIERNDVAIGISQGLVREIAIISRVGKPVCFKVISIDESFDVPKVMLSRVESQLEAKTKYLSALMPGDVIFGCVTHLENFGAFVDIGCGIISLIGIENISVSRIAHPSDRFYVGQKIYAVVSEKIDDKITLSHKELLGSWQQNADQMVVDATVTGIIRSVEHYGMFVELAPNLSGLAEFKDGFDVSDTVSVHIKSINPEKMKIKLNIIGKVDAKPKKSIDYFIKTGKISEFRYSPENCTSKMIIRYFT